METYRVLIWLKNNTQPICYDAIAAYVKGPFYCVVHDRAPGTEGRRVVSKYPVADIFRVEEEYRYIEYISIRTL